MLKINRGTTHESSIIVCCCWVHLLEGYLVYFFLGVKSCVWVFYFRVFVFHQGPHITENKVHGLTKFEDIIFSIACE